MPCKTALVEHAIESASDLEVLPAVGVESELELAFAALHQLDSGRGRCAAPLSRNGLLSESRAADALYPEAIERLARSRIVVHLARAHLVYGEWLRSERRRLEARQQLRTAHEMFRDIGAEAFAERATRELLATGERARKRSMKTREELTAQEAQIAWLARDGLSNPEIGARLFRSRNELERALPREPTPALSA